MIANTTTMNLKVERAIRGWAFYDGECPLCIASAKKFTPLLGRYNFKFEPLQTPWVQKRLGLKTGEPLAEMKLLTVDQRVFGGADALLQIAKHVWWAWPLFAIAKIPGVTPMFRAIYRRFAANRTCNSEKCSISKNHQYKPH